MLRRNFLIKIKLRHCVLKRSYSHEALTENKFLNKQIKIAAYQPALIENKIIAEENYHESKTQRFSMVFPPPNVTGSIHLGHALTATIQDVLVRWKRKQNVDTKWIFGTDHAGIATQVVVEKIILKQSGKSRHELGREQFLKEIWKWKDEKCASIRSDLKRLGTSFNWNREYFTLNSNQSEAVNEAFIRLFDQGLIYRANSLINWSCSLESAISDIEVESLEVNGQTEIAVPNYDKNVTVGVLTDFAYKIAGSSEEIIVSTTRPETMLGDVAIAVNPSDPRYSHLRDVQLIHPFRNEAIPLIFDESVDINFGTGAVKITPAHDKNDFEVGHRHKLPSIEVITEKGLIRETFDQFSGLKRFDARDKILDALADLNLLRGRKSHNMVLPICSRSQDIIEFMIKPQWFVRCDEMSKQAIRAVESGEMKIIPQNFEKEWYRWLTNCRDWCISRQLLWGHRIPAYKFHNQSEEYWIAARSRDEAMTKFKQKYPGVKSDFEVTRDDDVLDTWFSSGLLPFSVFNWPQKSEEFQKYFPLDLMETGHDILFFWVARMVMLSMTLTGKIPFKEVLLHGIVCDAYGRKMSKSLGNVILPEQIIKGATLDDLHKETVASVEKGIISKSELQKSIEGQKRMFPNGIQECGVDALRFTLCSQNVKQHFINFDVNDCVTNKLFFNKIWQATKFAINYAECKKLRIEDIKNLDHLKLSEMDEWILSRLANTINAVAESMNDYSFHHATTALKTFFYNNFCDVYIETTKEHLHTNDPQGLACGHVLNVCLSLGLSYMEVFTPYLSRELKPFLPEIKNIDTSSFINSELEKRIDELLDICGSIREIKAHHKITKKTDANITILIKSEDHESFLKNHLSHIKQLTFSQNIDLTNDVKKFEGESFTISSTASHICSFGIKVCETSKASSTDDAINKKKLTKLEKDLENMLQIVSNEGYKEKASISVQKKHMEKIEKLKLEIAHIRQL